MALNNEDKGLLDVTTIVAVAQMREPDVSPDRRRIIISRPHRTKQVLETPEGFIYILYI